jgi:ribosomal protein S18 acetylase RimI-like enzyme
MNFRTATSDDHHRLKQLYTEVAKISGGIAPAENEVTDNYIKQFLDRSLDHGLIIVAEHPDDQDVLIGDIHAYKNGFRIFDHVFTNLTIAVHPAFQGKKIGRTLFTIFQEEIAVNRPDIGRVELFVSESNEKAIRFYQTLGFKIEGRFEMRIRTAQNTYEADIPMSWQNPNFEFD